jgi:hypothetical protein
MLKYRIAGHPWKPMCSCRLPLRSPTRSMYEKAAEVMHQALRLAQVSCWVDRTEVAQSQMHHFEGSDISGVPSDVPKLPNEVTLGEIS